ncbi:MAG: 9-O-acetylesterase [Candidatus Omnitrophica bacterium]|nr:9-O-acetylesterase [Candidatus Omnitrophota bacterium]
MKRGIQLVLLWMVAMTGANAQPQKLSVAPLFTDHMVLQRDQPIAVWGWAEPGREVTVTLEDHESSSITDPSGKWRTTLPAMNAGGSNTLRISDGENEIQFEDVVIGEIWLCSGQSNMQYPLVDSIGGDEELALVNPSMNIRLCLIPKNPQPEPVERIEANWELCEPTSLKDFSAVAWYFAKELRKSDQLKDIPIGLIDSSYGGTRVEAWMSETYLKENFPDAEVKDSFLGNPPSSMYNGMIHALIPYTLRGVLWYQGESNVESPSFYRNLFPGLIEEWRTKWDRPDLPFYFVQLPNFAERFDGAYLTRMREVQDHVSKTVPHTAMAVTYDVGDAFDIHPADKKPVGERLGRIARALTYGEDIVHSGPTFKSMATEGSQVRIKFDHAGGGLTPKPDCDPVSGFVVCGEDGLFWNAEARIEGDSLILSSPEVPNPKYVRYAWEGDPEANFYNAEGLPAAPFRTDDFEIEDMQLWKQFPRYTFESSVYRAVVEGDGCLTELRIGEDSFLDSSHILSRGAFYVGVFANPIPLTQFEKAGPTIFEAKNTKQSIRYRFLQDRILIELSNSEREAARFVMVLNSRIESVPMEGELNEPRRAILGDSYLEIPALGRLSGPFAEGCPLWEISLEPGEEKTIELKVGKTDE